MRIFVLLLTVFFFGKFSAGQNIYKIKTDSLLVTNDSCIAEFNLENSTKSIKGFLYNRGNGRTEFRKGMIKINDSTYLFGNDTLKINQGLYWKQGGNSFGTTGIFGTTDNNHVDFYTNNILRGRIAKTGNWMVGSTTDLGQKFQVNGNASFYGSATINGQNPALVLNGDSNSYYPTVSFKAVTGTSYIQGYVGLYYAVPLGSGHGFLVNNTGIFSITSVGVKVANTKLLDLGWSNSINNITSQWNDRGALIYDTTNQMLRVNQVNIKQNSSTSGPGSFNKVNTSVLFERTTTNSTSSPLWVNGVTNSYAYGIADSSAFTATAQLTAVKSDGTEMAYGIKHIAFRKIGGTLTKVAETDIVPTTAEGSLSGITWTSVVADGIHLAMNVTGKASTTIKWRVQVTMNDMRF